MRAEVLSYCEQLANELRALDYHGQKIDVIVDVRDLRGGEKTWSWIKKGVPLRLEIGPRDIAEDKLMMARRDQPHKEKTFLKKQELVQNLPKILDEIQRILEPGGTLILSTPFIFGIHSDPYDFQRFTDEKLRKMLENDFEIITLKKQGLYFTVMAYLIKEGIHNSKSSIKRFFYLLFPVLDLLAKLDNYAFVKNSKFMRSFTTGFFVIAAKKRRG